jgi:hypothetical protein
MKSGRSAAWIRLLEGTTMTKSEGPEQTRRSFVKTVAYVAPAVLTLTATPAHAQYGSQQWTSEEKQAWYQQWLADHTGGED